MSRTRVPNTAPVSFSCHFFPHPTMYEIVVIQNVLLVLYHSFARGKRFGQASIYVRTCTVLNRFDVVSDRINSNSSSCSWWFLSRSSKVILCHTARYIIVE